MMKTILLAFFCAALCHGQEAGPFAKLGEFKSVEAFVQTVKAADLTKAEQPLAPIFVYRGETPDAEEVVCEKVSTCAVVPQEGKPALVEEAVVFANGSVGIKPKRKFVSVLFLLIRKGGEWTVADAKAIDSTGKKEPATPTLLKRTVMIHGLYYVDPDKHTLRYLDVR